jgi:hypothetical protein
MKKATSEEIRDFLHKETNCEYTGRLMFFNMNNGELFFIEGSWRDIPNIPLCNYVEPYLS